MQKYKLYRKVMYLFVFFMNLKKQGRIRFCMNIYFINFILKVIPTKHQSSLNRFRDTMS